MMKGCFAYIVALLLCFTLKTECVSMLDCIEGNGSTACFQCLKKVLTNITSLDVFISDDVISCENIISDVAHTYSSIPPPVDGFACISGTENTSSVVLVEIAPFIGAWHNWHNFYNIQTVTLHHSMESDDPLCGFFEITVVSEDPTPLSDSHACSDMIVNDNMTLSEKVPEFAFDDNVFGIKFNYKWSGSGYQQDIMYTRCIDCSMYEKIVLEPDDIIEVTAIYLTARLDTMDIDVPKDKFIRLANDSFLVCTAGPPVLGVPLATGRVPEPLTMVLIIISLIAIIVTFLTYCVFSELRNLPGKIVMNFLVALFIALLTVLIDLALPAYACIGAGPVFHYFWLSAFFWMNALSINTTVTLTRTTPIRKHKGNKKLFTIMIYGWGLL
ncbi:uncharacterized protein [Amphiura filiformis]|uniref:uncharacterized protein n=1 Tax=Amphiura filiformis TaxID=82378 RepID=UPI003B224DCA